MTILFISALLLMAGLTMRSYSVAHRAEVAANQKVVQQDSHIRDLQMKVSAANGKLGPLTQKINKLNEQLEELQDLRVNN